MSVLTASPKSSRAGNALISTLIILVLLSAFVGVAVDLTSSQGLVASRSRELNAAYAAADGVADVVFARWRAAMSSTSTNLNVQALTTPGTPGGNPTKLNITDVRPENMGFDAASLGGIAAPFVINPVQLTLLDAYRRPQPPTATIDVTAKQTGPADPIYSTAAAGQVGAAAGVHSWTITYKAEVQVASTLHGTIDSSGHRSGNPVVVGVRRYFTKRITPALQAAIFYNGQLELHPGDNTVISGWVHTNDNLYVGAQGTSKLDLTAAVTYNGYYNQDPNSKDHILIDEKSADAIYQKTAEAAAADGKIHEATYDGGLPQQVGRVDVGGINPTDLSPTNLNAQSYREMIERPVIDLTKNSPSTTAGASTDYNSYYANDPPAIRSQRVYNKASLKILITYKQDGSNKIDNVTVLGKAVGDKADGPDLSNTALGQAIVKDVINQYGGPAPDGAVSGQRTYVKDYREEYTGNSQVEVTTINVGALKDDIAKYMKNPDPSQPDYFNGILYVSDVTGSGSNNSRLDNPTGSGKYSDAEYDTNNPNIQIKHAIELTNGSQLPVNPNLTADNPDYAFTVATDNAVYIKGDYNTGGTGNAVPTNAGTGPDTTAPGYNKITAAVMADAVSVLSNNFTPASTEYSRFQYWTNDPKKVDPTPSNLAYDANAVLDKTGVHTADGQEHYVREGTNTTYNTAVVSCNTATDVGGSSGGAHNLLRLMENWRDRQLNPHEMTYSGSLMQIAQGKEFNGYWHNGTDNSYFNAARAIAFDKDFLTKPPAGSPVLINYDRGDFERF